MVRVGKAGMVAREDMADRAPPHITRPLRISRRLSALFRYTTSTPRKTQGGTAERAGTVELAGTVEPAAKLGTGVPEGMVVLAAAGTVVGSI